MKAIRTKALRNQFPTVYYSLVDRGLVGNGNIIFTHEVHFSSGGSKIEPYLILTPDNAVYEIQYFMEYVYINPVDIIGKELRKCHRVAVYNERREREERRKAELRKKEQIQAIRNAEIAAQLESELKSYWGKKYNTAA